MLSQRLGHKITKRRGDVKERGAGAGFRPYSVWAMKSPGRRGDVKERGAGAGFRPYSVWATKSPGGEEGRGARSGGQERGGEGGREEKEKEVGEERKSTTFTQGVRKEKEQGVVVLPAPPSVFAAKCLHCWQNLATSDQYPWGACVVHSRLHIKVLYMVSGSGAYITNSKYCDE